MIDKNRKLKVEKVNAKPLKAKNLINAKLLKGKK